MKIKVYVLTRQGRNNLDKITLEVLGVFTTKTAANELFKQKREEIRKSYTENYVDEPSYEDEEGVCVSWSISLEDHPVFDELLITEKIIDNG